MALRLALVCLLLTAHTAVAGPWPQPAGASFAALKLGAERDGTWRGFGELYGETGLSARLTASAKLRSDGTTHDAEGRLRWHPRLEGRALGLSLGAAAGAERPRALAALHLGRGFSAGTGQGWARLDLTRWDGPGVAAASELSAQVGLRHDAGWIGLLGATVHRRRGTDTARLRPALGRALTADTSLLAEATLAPRGRHLRGLALQLWHSF